MKPMTPQILGLHVAGALFWLVAVLHLLRALFGVEIIIAGWIVPSWISVIAGLVFAVLGWWIMKLAHPNGTRGCC